MNTERAEITCMPGDGIRTVSPETINAIDSLVATLPPGPWRIILQLPDATFRARPAAHTADGAAMEPLMFDLGTYPLIRERYFLAPDQRSTVQVPVIRNSWGSPVVEVAEEVLEDLLARAGYTPKETTE